MAQGRTEIIRLLEEFHSRQASASSTNTTDTGMLPVDNAVKVSYSDEDDACYDSLDYLEQDIS